jgi:hypothetical protein
MAPACLVSSPGPSSARSATTSPPATPIRDRFQWTATADEILAKVRLTQINIKKLVANNSK